LAKEKAYEETCAQLVLINEGTYHLEKELIIACPISIHGAGQDRTILHGYGIQIQGTKEEKKRVDMQDFTVKGSSECGLLNENGLSFSCTRMTFTQCGQFGVYALNTKGRLINCVITQCGLSGIWCHENALIELEGDQTKVDGNGTGEYGGYGLATSGTSSTIHFLFPLTKESVSTNNHGGGNYGSSNYRGTIKTVNTLEPLSNK
jgi:hypothetical protein